MKVHSSMAAGPLLVLAVVAGGAMPALAVDPSPSTTPAAPVCADGGPPASVTDATHPGDGIPDPAGRIVFGRFLRADPTHGQLVSLYAVDADGSDLALLLDCEVEFPRVSPDGSRVAFAIHMDDGSKAIATLAADGSDLRILTTGEFDEYPDWSPDGGSIIYSHVEDADIEAINRECPVSDCLVTLDWKEVLWEMNADGSDQRPVGESGTIDYVPRVSPDGNEVVFQRVDMSNNGWFTLMIRDLATGEERQVTDDAREPTLPEWSRDGSSILYFTLHEPGKTDSWWQIETVPADDATAAPIVLRPAVGAHSGRQPSYAPDGSRVVYSCEALCTMAADGSDSRVLLTTPDGATFIQPTWGPAPVG